MCCTANPKVVKAHVRRSPPQAVTSTCRSLSFHARQASQSHPQAPDPWDGRTGVPRSDCSVHFFGIVLFHGSGLLCRGCAVGFELCGLVRQGFLSFDFFLRLCGRVGEGFRFSTEWRRLEKKVMKIHVHSIMYRRSDLGILVYVCELSIKAKQSRFTVHPNPMQSMQFVVNTLTSTPTPC
ncbi:hypothetical protein BJX65DRAFT_170186 [Aspergillus insuetus]